MFVHDAMLENLFCKDTFVNASVFANKVQALNLQNPDTGNTYLEDEFEVSFWCNAHHLEGIAEYVEV